uniref:Ig-like domain-containing protein n=1 Tax=Candidatus Kentrum sp. LPFa TaxID=2126335 RepID=A0A450WJQ6_9GAMM|nr:MAG: Ig-like domain-containing protein [Candidatus Kentron sp. LPFa]
MLPLAGAYGNNTGTYRLTATALVSGTTAPLLLRSSPNDDATNVSPGADIRLTFNEAVSRGSGNIMISNLTSGGSRTIGVGDSRVRFSGNTVTIDPGGDLTAGQTMQVTFGPGVVKDLAGNNFSGLSVGSLNFTTARRTGLTSQQSTLLSTLRSEFDQEIMRITYDADVNDANLYPAGIDNARDYNGQCVSYVKKARTNLNFTWGNATGGPDAARHRNFHVDPAIPMIGSAFVIAAGSPGGHTTLWTYWYSS